MPWKEGIEMPENGRKKSTRKVRNLKVKSLSAAKAKQVKGGPIVWPGGPRGAGVTSLLPPAAQKVRE
jgi:hypothetical protein